MVVRWELFALLVAILAQVLYMQFYDAFLGTEDAKPAEATKVGEGSLVRDVLEVQEFLSADCEGPAARLWHLRPGSDMQCLNLRPRMKAPGSSGTSIAQALYGRASCESLRQGYVELCSEEGCSADGCKKVGVVEEGACGMSFTGFAAASWRCISESDIPS
mmetsp:Transcript_17900/g.31390  ORF Transcript_17900/g.31390 Transcript_17900/m.31390 type:complete len:161 (+) Transcript_17900:101-583(+)